MGNAYYQLISSQQAKNDVATILTENQNQIDEDDLDLCLRIEETPTGYFFLKGFYEIRKSGNFRKNLYKESAAISNTASIFQFVPKIIKGSFYLKHELFSELLGGIKNLVLEPKILKPGTNPQPTDLKVLNYKYAFIDPGAELNDFNENNLLPGGGKELFPSPPATGTYQ